MNECAKKEPWQTHLRDFGWRWKQLINNQQNRNFSFASEHHHSFMIEYIFLYVLFNCNFYFFHTQNHKRSRIQDNERIKQRRAKRKGRDERKNNAHAENLLPDLWINQNIDCFYFITCTLRSQWSGPRFSFFFSVSIFFGRFLLTFVLPVARCPLLPCLLILINCSKSQTITHSDLMDEQIFHNQISVFSNLLSALGQSDFVSLLLMAVCVRADSNLVCSPYSSCSQSVR